MSGVHHKYLVKRTDGKDAPGQRHEHCAYFVLDLHCDEHALAALKAYARSCKKDNPELAADLLEIVDAERPRCGCREAFCPHTPMFGPQNASDAAHEKMAEAAHPSAPGGTNKR